MFIEKIKDNHFRKRFEEAREIWQKRNSGDLSVGAVDPETLELAKELRAPFLPPSKIIHIDKKIEYSDNLAVPNEVLDYFIKEASHRVIANFCGCRDMSNCKDYPIGLGCMFLGEASRGIHPEFAHPASIEEALEHAQRWREAGLVIHLGYVPYDARFFEVGPANRLMSICGCCPCCCVSRFIQYHRMPGIEVRVSGSCNGCGICLKACPYGLIEIQGEKAQVALKCIACGRCVDTCPEKAIEVTVVDPDYVQKTIEWVSGKVDVT